MKLQPEPVEISDLVAFADLEANIVTNPVFGRISDSVKLATSQRSCGCKTARKKPKNLRFLIQVDGCECSPGLPDASEPGARDYREQSLQSREVPVPGTNPVSSRKKRRCLL